MSQYECPYNNNGNKDCSIVRRLVHLCESKFICRFDDICPVTGQYSLDISEADATIGEYDARCRDAEAKAASLKNQLKEAKEHILEIEKKNTELSDTINRMHGGCERAIELHRLLYELFGIERDQVVSDDEIRKMMENLRDECTKLTKENIQLYKERIQLKNEKKQQADDILELRTELEQLHTQRRITEMIYKSDAEAVVKGTDAKIQSINDQSKKQLKDAKERADNGWERVRYLERKLKDTESLNEQLLRELARRDESADAVKPVDNLISLIGGWFDSALDNGVLYSVAHESETVSDANAYQEDILKYAPDFDTVAEAMKYAVIGLCGEAGEASEIVKKHVYHGHPLDDEHLMRELGDVLWYVAYMAHLLSCPLNLIMALNQDKLAKRYPDGKFDPEKSQNRKAGDI